MDVDRAREVMDGYAEYVAETAAYEFKPSNVVNLPLVSERRAKRRISGVLDDLKSGQTKLLTRQYTAVLDGCLGDVDEHASEFLDGEIYLRKYRGDDREAFEDAVEDRYRSVCRQLEPAVSSDSQGFWRAFPENCTLEEAVSAFESLFGAHEAARRFEDEIVLAVKIPLTRNEYEYTRESIRAFRAAETEALTQVKGELEDVY